MTRCCEVPLPFISCEGTSGALQKPKRGIARFATTPSGFCEPFEAQRFSVAFHFRKQMNAHEEDAPQETSLISVPH